MRIRSHQPWCWTWPGKPPHWQGVVVELPQQDQCFATRFQPDDGKGGGETNIGGILNQLLMILTMVGGKGWMMMMIMLIMLMMGMITTCPALTTSRVGFSLRSSGPAPPLRSLFVSSFQHHHHCFHDCVANCVLFSFSQVVKACCLRLISCKSFSSDSILIC